MADYTKQYFIWPQADGSILVAMHSELCMNTLLYSTMQLYAPTKFSSGFLYLLPSFRSPKREFIVFALPAIEQAWLELLFKRHELTRGTLTDSDFSRDRL
ncbi:MAG: hypothetical protein WAX89_01720 [Alphaproteobacteria bacterium]